MSFRHKFKEVWAQEFTFDARWWSLENFENQRKEMASCKHDLKG